MVTTQKQNPVTVVVLLLVIATAIAFFIRSALPKRYPRQKVDWLCETCNHQFIDKSQTEPMKCPKCGAEAVRIYYYHCSLHDHIFEAYRSKPDPDAIPEEFGLHEMPPPEHMLYKAPGEDWTKSFPKKIACPEGNSDRKTITYCPVSSELRR